MKSGNVCLRKLNNSNSDYRLLEKWYQEKEVYSHFEQRKLSYEEIENKYFPRTLKNAQIPVYMIEYDNVPIGIIQYQLINEDNQKLYQLYNNNSYEIDIFIGELSYHNKGIGKISIELVCDYLLDKKEANYLVMCPLKNNYSAIKCYLKCGFKSIKEFNTKDTVGIMQTYILMIKERWIIKEILYKEKNYNCEHYLIKNI